MLWEPLKIPSPSGHTGIYTTFHRNKNNKLQKCHTPSPVGEGRGEENKINCLHSPHPGLLLYALWVLWRRGD